MRLTVTSLLLASLAPLAGAQITTYDNFTDYDNAVGGNHSLFVDFETDKNGVAVVPFEDIDMNGRLDIEGTTFSCDVVYSSPDFPSSRTNIAAIAQGIDNEIGPFPEWDGTLRWDYGTSYIATAFTGVSVDSTTMLRLYNGNALVDEVVVGGNNGTFQFFGFVSTNPFDRVELNGLFFAIDAHYSTEAPECFLVIGSGSGIASFGGIGHLWQTQVSGIMASYPVSLNDIPSFQLPVQQKKISQLKPVKVAQFAVQVLMWNPTHFPTNPEQSSRGILATQWSNGRVTGRTYGSKDNMDIALETYINPADGLRYVHFPFSINGFTP